MGQKCRLACFFHASSIQYIVVIVPAIMWAKGFFGDKPPIDNFVLLFKTNDDDDDDLQQPCDMGTRVN